MNSIDLKKNEISSLPISRVGLYCIVFEKKIVLKIRQKNCIVLFSNFVLYSKIRNCCCFVLYSKNQISRFPTYRVKAKKLHCIVFKTKKNK